MIHSSKEEMIWSEFNTNIWVKLIFDILNVDQVWPKIALSVTQEHQRRRVHQRDDLEGILLVTRCIFKHYGMWKGCLKLRIRFVETGWQEVI